jgi:tRNA threonylcarbamoyl adenosine modification protein YjeE
MSEEFYRIASLKETQDFACKLDFTGFNIITLSGELGAGKTAFARFFISNYLKNPHLEITSPSFSILNVYRQNSKLINHFDLYRIKNINELAAIGFEEILNEGVSLIEWAGVAGEILKHYPHIDIHIENNAENRLFKLTYNRPL